jgi:hypothetical protein
VGERSLATWFFDVSDTIGGAKMVDKTKLDAGANPSSQRELVVAYLRYALDDVSALSPVGLRLLQMTIASLTEEVPVNIAVGELSRWLS